MNIIDVKSDIRYLKEYILLCNLEWEVKKSKEEINSYIEDRINIIKKNDKVISII